MDLTCWLRRTEGDVECDIVGAARLGFRTIWYNPSGARWPDDRHNVAPEISVWTIDQLARLLGVV